jgi:chromosome segregation ATPase
VSDSERPDLAALRELEQLIGALGDEMAAWRRRAHAAEARCRELEDLVTAKNREPASAPEPASETMAELQSENEALRRRLEAARVRTRQLLDRLRFLRQQHQQGVER